MYYRNDYLESQSIAELPLSYTGKDDTSKKAIPLIYGYRRIDGQLLFAQVGSNPNVLYAVIGLCEGTATSIERILVDGSLAWDSNLDGELTTTNDGGTIQRGYYNNRIEIEFLSGLGSSESSTLLSEIGRSGTTFPNIACLVVKMTKDPNNDELFRTFPTFTIDVVGKLGTDPNPAAVVEDLLKRVGIESIFIDRSNAYNFYDTTVNLSDTLEGKLAACNAIIDTSNSIPSEIQKLCDEFLMLVPDINGKYYIIAEAAGGSATAITEANILGDITALYPDVNVQARNVLATFPNGFGDFSNRTITVEANPDMPYDKRVTFPNIVNPYQVTAMAEIVAAKANNQILFTFTLARSAFDVDVGDLLNVTVEAPQSANTDMKVISKKLNGDGTVSVEAIKWDSSYYAISPAARITFDKPLIPSPDGYIYYPSYSTGQTPQIITTPPLIRGPGEVRSGSGFKYTIPFAETLDDNGEWYLSYSEDGATLTNNNTFNSATGVSTRIVETLNSSGIYLHTTLALINRNYRDLTPYRIAYTYEWRGAQFYYHNRIHLAKNAYSFILNGVNEDLNATKFSGANRTSRFYRSLRYTNYEEWCRDYNYDAFLYHTPDTLEGIYLTRLNTEPRYHGLNYAIPGTEKNYAIFNDYTEQNQYDPPDKPLRTKFYYQMKQGGAWTYIGYKDINIGTDTIATAYRDESAALYRAYTGKTMPT